MGKQSTRENKNIYQLCREAQGLTREKASENMEGISASRIEKIEYELQEPTPYDIIQMADCYKRPDLCNYYCSHKCIIGDRYVPEVEMSELSNIILETIASLQNFAGLPNHSNFSRTSSLKRFLDGFPSTRYIHMRPCGIVLCDFQGKMKIAANYWE